MTLAFIRWCTALTFLLPFAVPLIWKNRRIILAHWGRLVLLGTLSVACFNTLAYTGLQTTTAINGTLMQSTMPIMILILSALVLREKASLKQWLGVAVSLCGVLLLISRAQLDRLLQMQFNVGDLWVMTAMLVWGVYSIGLRWKPKELQPLPFFLATLTVGVIVLSPLALWQQLHAPPLIWTQERVMVIAYLAIFPSILAYLFWNYGVEKLGAGKAGLFIHLVPFWGILLSVIFLDETVQTFHFAGMGLIFVGIYLAVLSDRTIMTTNK